jgi:hypothetical protein
VYTESEYLRLRHPVVHVCIRLHAQALLTVALDGLAVPRASNLVLSAPAWCMRAAALRTCLYVPQQSTAVLHSVWRLASRSCSTCAAPKQLAIWEL